MKFKTIFLIFPAPLTKPQEYVLIVNMKAVIGETQKGIDKITGKLDSAAVKAMCALPGMDVARMLIKNSLGGISINANSFFYLERITPEKYEFGYAWENLSLIRTTIQKYRIVKGSVFSDAIFIDGLKRFVFPDMGLEGSSVKIEHGEAEK